MEHLPFRIPGTIADRGKLVRGKNDTPKQARRKTGIICLKDWHMISIDVSKYEW